MYSITLNDNLLYSPLLTEAGRYVLNPVLNLELNTAGSLSFTLTEDNPLYLDAKPLSGIVNVYEDGNRIFRGRIVTTSRNFYRQKKVTCEGDLAFLNDAVLRPYSYTGTAENYYRMLISAYISSAGIGKNILIGNISFPGYTDNIVRSSEYHVNLWEELREKLIESKGGYIMPRYVTTGGVDYTYFDYLSASGVTGNQVIRFGKNLINLDDYLDGTDTYTVIVPLGAMDEDTQQPIDITSVNGGSDHLTDTDAADLYGNIERVVEWDDVTLPQYLKNKAQSELLSGRNIARTITISAIDLHLLDVDTDALHLGDTYKVISYPHGLTDEAGNNTFQLVKCKIDLTNPTKSVYTFGKTLRTLTGG